MMICSFLLDKNNNYNFKLSSSALLWVLYYFKLVLMMFHDLSVTIGNSELEL